MTPLGLALRLARRELRGGLNGFRIFLACLTLGVAGIATVQSVSLGILAGLRADGQAILGGDVAVRTLYQAPTDEQRTFMANRAQALTRTAEMRGMARVPGTDASALVELKAVEGAYPLYGSVELAGAAVSTRRWRTATAPGVSWSTRRC